MLLKINAFILKIIMPAKPIDVQMQRCSVSEWSENLDNKSASLLIPNLYNMHLTEVGRGKLCGNPDMQKYKYLS